MSVSTLTGGPNGNGAPTNEIPPELAARLADPRVADSLGALLDRLDVAVLLLSSVDELLGRGETILDSAVESAADARQTIDGAVDDAGRSPGLAQVKDLNLRDTADAGAQLLLALPEMAPVLLRGFESGAIDQLTSEALVEMLHIVSAGASAGLKDPDPIEVKGALSIARAMKDPDVARGLGFFLTILRAIGRSLATERAASPTRQAASGPEEE